MVSSPRHTSNRKCSIRQLSCFSALFIINSHTLFDKNLNRQKTLTKKTLANKNCEFLNTMKKKKKNGAIQTILSHQI